VTRTEKIKHARMGMMIVFHVNLFAAVKENV
jgi:hypothetical protein